MNLEQQTVTGAQLATVLSLTDRRIRDLAAAGIIKVGKDKKFFLAESVRAYVGKLRDRKDTRTIAAAKLRKLELEIDALAREKERDEGRCVPVDEMAARLTPGLSAMRQIILTSSLDDEERDQLIESLGQVFSDAIRTPSKDTDDEPKSP